jgi:uronate dehydrogenase
MKRVLLTGAGGKIGTALRNRLVGKVDFRCLDITPIADAADFVQADVMDFSSLLQAMDGMDAVIHLAGHPGFEQGWESVYRSGIGGTYNVFEAARQAGVQHVIYTSSTAVLGWRELEQGKIISPEMPIYPLNLYGIGKATGEMLARYFSEEFGLSITCLRTGSFFDQPNYIPDPDSSALKAWISPDDFAQLISKILDQQPDGFRIYYAVSNNTHRHWSIENAAKDLNYTPSRNAEDFIKPSNTLPSLLSTHALLLKAVLQSGDAAINNWQAWLDAIDIENTQLDTFSYRLLPLVYENFTSMKISHSMLKRLKGVYRRSWLDNQFLLQKTLPLLNKIQAAGIPLTVLDDFTSILRLYDGQGQRRPMALNLLVQPADVAKLLTFLRAEEIWPKIQHGENYLQVEPSLEVWSPLDIPISLSWRALPAISTPEQALAIWSRTQESNLGDLTLRALDLETHFVRLCLNTISDRYDRGFFSLVDLAWILAKRSQEVDWDKVVRLTIENNLVLPVRQCLEMIQSILPLEAAVKLHHALENAPVRRRDRVKLRFCTQHNQFPSFCQRIRCRWINYLDSPKIPGLFGPLRYLQYAWGVPRLRELPKSFIHHLFKSAKDFAG